MPISQTYPPTEAQMEGFPPLEDEEPPMLDVHPPHASVHSWKDFAIHIATITIGLLIAIGLEQTVEAVHHRNLCLETRESLRREITENQKTLQEDLKSLDEEQQMLEHDVEILRQLRGRHAVAGQDVKFNWQWPSMQDSAWQTARETTTIALFPSEQIQHFSSTYLQQSLVNEGGLTFNRDLTDAAIPIRMEPDLTALTPSQIDEVIRGCAVSLNQIQYVQALARTLVSDYQRVLSLS